jgi:hypothetical protein
LVFYYVCMCVLCMGVWVNNKCCVVCLGLYIIGWFCRSLTWVANIVRSHILVYFLAKEAHLAILIFFYFFSRKIPWKVEPQIGHEYPKLRRGNKNITITKEGLETVIGPPLLSFLLTFIYLSSIFPIFFYFVYRYNNDGGNKNHYCHFQAPNFLVIDANL